MKRINSVIKENMAQLIVSLAIKESIAKLKARLTFSRGINMLKDPKLRDVQNLCHPKTRVFSVML